jgi:anti-anti-sigma factor
MIDTGTDDPDAAPTLCGRLSLRCTGQRVTLVGELDAGTAPCVASALEMAGLVGDVDVDLGGVTFMDAGGLRSVLRLRELLVSNGCSMRVVATSPAVQRVLEITAELAALRP